MAGLKGCWCRGSGVFVCSSYSWSHSFIVLTLRSRSAPLRSVSTWISFCVLARTMGGGPERMKKTSCPLPSLEPLLRRGLSRGCAQRFGFRRYGCVVSINWFAGLANSAADSDATEMQHCSMEAIRGVREREVNGRAHTFSKHEAVRALLQGGPGSDTLDFPLAAWPCTTTRASDAASQGRCS